ncbi:hypothetical protein ISN45_Aa07g018560 [Arabidopsis thaliana x Arabidopsis arenosa]|uniref:Uncharacterized protein n=1 Tax=Arabidopsis thaliana x Arabidopsis arenosa TaxID=1240361 RepID=A0A8T1Y481_9BRAS|nr:hypothetical protein ISN45_Aa07g018560 [Arabidopsis thaliana x Arabidopsis arenosa]
MTNKSQPSRLSPDEASPLPQQPCKALPIRGQSSKVKSPNGEATGSQMKPSKTRKAPYKALLIRARSPDFEEYSSESEYSSDEFSYEADGEASDSSSADSDATDVKTMKNKTARKAPISQEPEAGMEIEEPNKRRRISEKDDDSEDTMSWEPEVKKTP